MRAEDTQAPVVAGLQDRIRLRVERLRRELPVVPGKALLSRDGGLCPRDGAALVFDPWSPTQHRCARCGQVFGGVRHDGHWARAQHLWLAERVADLGTLAAVEGDREAAERAWALLAGYEERYFELPNRDNVLGPSHLFFSTYLESVWLTNWLAGAAQLREAGLLPDDRVEGVSRVAEEAAAIVAEFNEGMSNRQTWHSAALVAIGVWFGDDELIQNAVESRTGLLGHLVDGFGDDGVWWEGENYHLFALRGWMHGLSWARRAGYDLLEDAVLRQQFRNALLGPERTALPDLTYPARKDSRYGVSLAQPAHLELFEVGRSWLGEDAELDRWLGALRRLPPPSPEHNDAWLHEAALPDGGRHAASDPRERLSWWALHEVDFSVPTSPEPWRGQSVYLEGQRLAVLRVDGRYVSVECGRGGGGHGHPDVLHLTLHAGGVHWLPDPGTGSYVDRSLFWYRSRLAHNAPLLDGGAPQGEARCEAFDVQERWGSVRARVGNVVRSVVVGPAHVVDVVAVEPGGSRVCDVAWHFPAAVTLEPDGPWEATALDSEFVTEVQRLVTSGPVRATAIADSGARLIVHFLGQEELLRGMGPGLPGSGSRTVVLVQRTSSYAARFITILTTDSAPEHQVQGIAVEGSVVTIQAASRTIRVRFGATGVPVEDGADRATLGGIRLVSPVAPPSLGQHPGWEVEGYAPFVDTPPALNGTLDGFDTSAPIELEGEHQYLRSEEPYDPERFRARAWVNRDAETLYLAVEVEKPDLCFRPRRAPPLDLDNEVDDIHSDGVQVYLRFPEADAVGVLVVPEIGGHLRVSAAGGTAADPAAVTGSWARTERGYRVTLAWREERLLVVARGGRIGFDLMVNEMRPDRVRRAGQLVWSGGGGWVYLRGDRPDPARWGSLVLG
jgi:hypothetical protein